MSIIKFISSKILIGCYIAICVFCLLGVSAFAANTGLSPSLGDGDDRSDDHPAARSSTDTDIQGKVGSIGDEISILDSPVILLEHGTIVMANDLEGTQTFGATASQNDSVGYSIEVSSSIGSQLLVPSDYSEDSFAVDGDGYLIGIRSGTFSCYIGDYTVRFPSYGTPQYRLTSGISSTWNDINITYVKSSNVEIVGDRFNWYDDKFRTLIAVAGLCSLLILAFRRRD